MLELPELFGSPYVLPGLIIVVLLLVVLLLLSINRRRRTRPADSTPTPPGSAPVPPEPGGPLPAAGRDRTADAYSEPFSERTGASLPPTAGAWSPPADPIAEVITDLLRGWGDLTAEDTNRLRIFRPDKVAAAIGATELPKDLKNSKHAQARLSQLRLFAASLQTAPATAAGATEQVPPEAALPAAWAGTSEGTGPATDQLPPGPMPAESPEQGGLFPSLRATVTTAEQLLALSPPEQADLLAFLSPAELQKVFQRTADSNLKKSVIDTLEHIANADSLNVISLCLDDPDPEIQVYALDAANRLLGDS